MASSWHSQYGRVWEYLRREFDVEARFETIEDKVNYHHCYTIIII